MRVLRFMEQMLPATAARGAVFAIHAGVGGCGLGRQPAPSVGLGQGLQSQSQATRCASSSNSNLRRGQGNYSLGRGAGGGYAAPGECSKPHLPNGAAVALPLVRHQRHSNASVGRGEPVCEWVDERVFCSVRCPVGGRSRNVKLAMMGAECQRYSVPARTTGPDWRLSWSIDVN